METILVVNAGSSSVKFQVFGIEAADKLKQLVRGEMDGIGVRPRLRAKGVDDRLLVEKTYPTTDIPDVASAMRVGGAWLRDTQQLNPIAVGHRVVHGGPEYDRPTLVDHGALDRLKRYIPLAPLHQPNNLAPIQSLLERYPSLPQVACFDTAFHRGHSAVADHYALPQRFYAEGVRRYGFHGLSYEYVAAQLQVVAPTVARGKVIIAHLGSGASMCAISNGHSVESTMGFTALDGLPMGTRPGQIDPGIVLYLLTEKGLSAAEIEKLLYHGCGLKGLSGISNDVRELLENPAAGAALALDHFVYRVGLYAGMLAASLGGLEAFVFTAGVGERSAAMRSRIAERLTWLGAELDPVANAAGKPSISREGSRVGLYIVPTNEELMIAQHTLTLVSAAGKDTPAFVRTA
jgi:acetate kinase